MAAMAQIKISPGRYNFWQYWWIYAFGFISYYANTEAFMRADCKYGLGMQEMTIRDEDLTASSSSDPHLYGPEYARIRSEAGGGAWCPKNPIVSDTYEWLQITFEQLTVVTNVETQGRFGNGQGQEYVAEFRLEYQREDTGQWFIFKNRRGQEIFQGNTNTYTADMHEVDPPIIGKRIRFVPHGNDAKMVCMRVELYGCRWLDGVVSYDMPQGDRRSNEVDLSDLIYDGSSQSGELIGGLGLLTDRLEGASNLRLRSHGWVGWKNETRPRPIEIVFKFDTLRNFTKVRFFCSNNGRGRRDVKVFRMASISFSIGGKLYAASQSVVFAFMRDDVIENDRWVEVGLENRIGRYVKVELHFDTKWILISEVQFDSVIVLSGNFSEEVPPLTTPHPSSITTNLIVPLRNREFSDADMDPAAPIVIDDVDSSSPLDDSDDVNTDTGGGGGMNGQGIAIIIGALVSFIILLVAILLFIILRNRRRHKFGIGMGGGTPIKHAAVPNGADTPGMIRGAGIIPNAACAYVGVSVTDVDHEFRDGLGLGMGLGSQFDGSISSTYKDPFDLLQRRRLPDVPHTSGSSSDTNTSRDYAVPDISSSSHLVPNSLSPQLRRPLAPPSYSTLHAAPLRATLFSAGNNNLQPIVGPYASSDIFRAQQCASIQGLSGSSVYAVFGLAGGGGIEGASTGHRGLAELGLPEFPRQQLRFVENLGGGEFGEVNLCEAIQVSDFLESDFLLNGTESFQTMLVAVKSLRRGASSQMRNDFEKEIRIMSRLKDPNVVHVLGVCTREPEPLCVVVEYMKYGDLNNFLQQHCSTESAQLTRNHRLQVLSHGCLVYMAMQIVSGMKYLESLNLVHRDLAARNCLVGPMYAIKISDFGMSRSLYTNDYYRMHGGPAALPIRWMAWESVWMGKFTTSSDVWSFGITLWEILTFARHQPYENLTNEQVLDNCEHFYREDGLAVCLPPPSGNNNCPREIYDLMRTCWDREPANRPSFKEIHMFLQRKNTGYNPQEEHDSGELLSSTASVVQV